jgi:AcrR family transcriptional regulator
MVRPSESTRHAIIKAAVDLFAKKGFEGVSVRDIVTKARVNQAAVNYHFKGKSGCKPKSSKLRSRTRQIRRDLVQRNSGRFPARTHCEAS